MIDAASSGTAALKAFQKKMDVTANNVANVNTDEFKKSRVTMSEGSNGGVTATIDQVDSPGIPKETVRNGEPAVTESSNVDLAEELTEMITTETAYKANAKAVQTHDQMIGALLDLFS